ncbi:hypothetical protein V6O07_23255 [Arthrospira platensis SPKY2]
MKNEIININKITEISLEKVILIYRIYNRRYKYKKNGEIEVLEDLKRIIINIEKEIKKAIKGGYYIDLSYGEKRNCIIITNPLKIICIREEIEDIKKLNKGLEKNFLRTDNEVYINKNKIKEIKELKSYRKLDKSSYINISKEILYISELSKEEKDLINEKIKKRYIIETNEEINILCSINPFIYKNNIYNRI